MPPRKPAQLAAGPVQDDAEAVRVLTGALFVVVTDDRGIRLAHPEPESWGCWSPPIPPSPWPAAKRSANSGARSRVREGEGPRARARRLCRGRRGQRRHRHRRDLRGLWSDLRVAALYAAAALGLGVFASVLLSRRLRRLTLGVEPEELAAMASEHEAVLGGISEAVFGVDPNGRIGVANGEAGRLFGDGSDRASCRTRPVFPTVC